MTNKEIRELTDEQLLSKIEEAKEELFNLRFQQATGSLEKPSRIHELRKEVAGMIAQNPGKELSDILNEHRDEFNGRLNLHSDAQREYNKFLEEGDAEGAEEYRLQANELLAEYGVEPIKAETDDEESDGDDPGAGQN